MARLPRVLLKPRLAQRPCLLPACCGYVSTVAVLEHFRLEHKGLWEELEIETQHGTYPEDLYRALTRKGLGVQILQAPLTPKTVRSSLLRNEPIVLMMRCGGNEESQLHWVTIGGQWRGKYLVADSRNLDGPKWLRIEKKQQLFAFSVGWFRSTIGVKQFSRLGDTTQWSLAAGWLRLLTP